MHASLRALLDEPGESKEAPGFFGVGGVEVALTAGANAVALNPWLDEIPVALARAVADVDVDAAPGPVLADRHLLPRHADHPVRAGAAADPVVAGAVLMQRGLVQL